MLCFMDCLTVGLPKAYQRLYAYRRLTKVLYAAVRFIFSFKYSQRRCHVLPHLKKLHFLPTKYRINFKIALLVFKCLKQGCRVEAKSVRL